jgi:hypothetical protein
MDLSHGFNRRGVFVRFPRGSDPNSDEAETEYEFTEVLKSVSKPKDVGDYWLVARLVEWLYDDSVKDDEVYATLREAVYFPEIKYRELASELLPGYSGDDDDPRLAAIICQYGLQPSAATRNC